MQRTFFVGDIHGCPKTFEKLVTQKIGLRKNDKLYCVGDYIDRGVDSKGVIDFILELRKMNYQVFTLRGNHEQMLLDASERRDAIPLWLTNGGDATMESFNISSIEEIEPVYLDFFRKTEFFVRTNDFIAAHAGLNFNIDDPVSDKNSMLWIRGFEADKSYLDGRQLIHGHTPLVRERVVSQKFTGVVNIDGGCVYKSVTGMGSLFAIDFYAQKFIEAENID